MDWSACIKLPYNIAINLLQVKITDWSIKDFSPLFTNIVFWEAVKE